MASKPPTLLRYQLRQHALAASVTLGVMLVILLALADYLALHAAARALAMDLRANEQAMSFPGGRGGRGGRLVLDEQGVPLRGNGQAFPAGRGPGLGGRNWQTPWSLAPAARARGELQGTSPLPWVKESVVWAARALPGEAGDMRVLIAWTQVKAIRAATGTTYFLVILAIGLAFLVSLGFTVRTLRTVSRAVTDVSTAGRQMAAGNFTVRVPPQATGELDELRTVVSELASHLDTTLTDLRAEHVRLTRLEQAQRQFVADASHELRAPLSAMALTLDAWRDGLLHADEQPEAITHLHDEVKRLSRIVAELLDLARIDSGRQPVVLDTLDAGEVCAQVLLTLAESPGAPVRLEVPADLPAVLADRDALHRVLRNLLDNALRFTPADGKIRLWADADDEGVRIGVTDTGRGIPAEMLPRVWDRFARAEHARDNRDGGTGLGLAIVKALVEAMTGSVGVDSTEGAGTTVWVRLARAENVSET